MKVILEKSDLLEIIGKHFDTLIDPEKVVIRTEPHLEVELSGIVMTGSETAGGSRKKADAAVVEEAASIEEVLAESKELEERQPRSERNVLSAVPSDFDKEVE